jgi:tetratricopeptide (TPR) repeat protein
MSHQLTDPAPLVSRYGDDDITSWMLLDHPEQGQDPNEITCSCSVCHQPSAAHFVSIHNTIPQQAPRSILNDNDTERFGLPTTTKEEGAWKWIALCFAACLHLKKGNEELSTKSLSDASTELERLVCRRDRLLLTAANQMITILHLHSQGLIAETITATAKKSIDRMLPDDDPIRITFNYLAATANSSNSAELENSGITSSTLYGVYQSLDADPAYGSQHPYTISASYNYAWLLRYEGKFEEAEQRLPQVYKTSCSIFGKHHMQSITAVATLAGVQSGQKKTKEAIENFKIAIRDCEPTLGKSHPYRLEATRRLAQQYEALGQKKKMVPLYWEVLAGRVRMLGPKHKYTLGQRKDYEELMQELGRWDTATQREVEMLFGEGMAASSKTRRRYSGDGSDDGSGGSEYTAF